MAEHREGVGSALLWAAGITAAEAIVRRRIASRSRAWLVAYSAVGVVAGVALVSRGSARTEESRDRRRRTLLAGLALAGVGYPLGRSLLRDRPVDPPPESLGLETLALAGAVAPAEEMAWGALVEPAIGIGPTSALFATKHAVIDGRWGRWLGLGLFNAGLGLLRRRSRPLALAVHIACNAGGVALGHLTGKDQF